MTDEQQNAIDEIKRIMKETGFNIIGSSQDPIEVVEASAILNRPCSGPKEPCCGGKCGS